MQKRLDKFLNNSDDNHKILFNITSDKFDENDWTFKSANTTELTHLIFNNYPARMIPQIPRKLILLIPET